MMIASFVGYEFTLEAYRHAVQEKYRFFSFGDCMLITKEWERKRSLYCLFEESQIFHEDKLLYRVPQGDEKHQS